MEAAMSTATLKEIVPLDRQRVSILRRLYRPSILSRYHHHPWSYNWSYSSGIALRALPGLRELSGDEYLEESIDDEDTAPSSSDDVSSVERGNRSDILLSRLELLSTLGLIGSVTWATSKAWLASRTAQIAWTAPMSWILLPLTLSLALITILRIRITRTSSDIHHLKRMHLQASSQAYTGRKATIRMDALENGLQESSRMIQTLSRQVEKLGVRFRVTKRTIRDPLKETMALAEKTSQVVESLSAQLLHAEIELRESQATVMAMQDQSARQLELFVTSLKQSQKVQSEMMKRIVAMEKTQQEAIPSKPKRSTKSSRDNGRHGLLAASGSGQSGKESGNNVISLIGSWLEEPKKPGSAQKVSNGFKSNAEEKRGKKPEVVFPSSVMSREALENNANRPPKEFVDVNGGAPEGGLVQIPGQTQIPSSDSKRAVVADYSAADFWADDGLNKVNSGSVSSLLDEAKGGGETSTDSNMVDDLKQKEKARLRDIVLKATSNNVVK